MKLAVLFSGGKDSSYAMYKVYAEVYGIDVIEIKGKSPDYKITVEQIKEVVPNIKVLIPLTFEAKHCNSPPDYRNK